MTDLLINKWISIIIPENGTMPTREERSLTMSTEQKRRGPKAKHPEGFKELHLKFSGELLQHIERYAWGNYQTFFDTLIHYAMEHEDWRKLAWYTELMRCISVGAYLERDEEGNYAEDGIEEGVDTLDRWAWEQGRQFVWHQDGRYWTLEPMSTEEVAAYKAAMTDANV